MSTTSEAMACAEIAKESPVPQLAAGSAGKSEANSITAGASSKGVTPGAKPSACASMSRW
jgi:hypothetical protein